MKSFKRTFIRPHTDAEWYTPSPEFLAYVQEHYIDTGSCTKFREMTYTDSSKLVMTLESVWDNFLSDEDLAMPMWANELAKELEHNAAWEIILIDKTNTNS